MGREKVSMTPVARDAAALLGHQVRLARFARRWTLADLAGRSGASVGTVSNLEAGSPNVSIGNAFNIAVAVGINLFSMTPDELARIQQAERARIALLPARVNNARDLDNVDLDF